MSWDRDSSAAKNLPLPHTFFLGWVVPGFLLLGGQADHEVHHTVAVAIFIVTLGNELYDAVIRAMPAPASKVGEWASLLKS